MASAVATLDQLPTEHVGTRAPLWWAFLFLIGIEIIVFGGLISSYFYLKGYATDWPASNRPPDLLLPTINSVVLVLSSVAIFLGDRALQRGDQRAFKLGQATAVLLALVFLTLKAIEYAGLDYRWDTHAYGSISWTMSGFHAAHVISVSLKGLVVLAMAFRGRFTPTRRLGVQVNGLYWHFVTAIWFAIYGTLYLSPRIG